jgi:SAM-dependent methyltransferase
MDETERIQRRYEERDACAALTGFWSLKNPTVLHAAQERERCVLAALGKAAVNLSALRVLDVGCGFGLEYPSYMRWGVPAANVVGIDLSHVRLAQAAQRLGMSVVQASGAALPFADASFDLVVQNVVFSSITDDSMRRATALEMLRVLRPDGHVLWYDAFRSRGRDPHFRSVPRVEVCALFPGVDWTFATLTSDIGIAARAQRWLGGWSLPFLDASRVFRTHLLGLAAKR